MDQETLQKLKKELEGERERLVAELKSIAEKDPHMKGDWDARFPQFEANESGSHSSLEQEQDEVEEYETRLEAEHSLESRLLEVQKALGRIEHGGYGKCAKCGKDIPMERMNANPAAEFCIEHAR